MAQSPGNNIYTVLALVALLALICGIVVVWFISTPAVFGPDASPWSLTVSADLLRSLLQL
ncbi:MAG: hypothetical protein IT445_14230 [Phycisphaeraceae bacterium]|nr:hypothetical protein [Phycisphaeraceae bacterium]